MDKNRSTKFRLDLDSKNDILYIIFRDAAYRYGEESDDGIFVVFDEDDDSIVGVTISDFLRRMREGTINKIDLPIKLDFIQDIIPQVLKLQKTRH